jgi:hypothetical protein
MSILDFTVKKNVKLRLRVHVLKELLEKEFKNFMSANLKPIETHLQLVQKDIFDKDSLYYLEKADVF